MQLGALAGMLSQRVLGQYDLALLDANVTPRLLLLAPNLAQAARTLDVDRDELVLWVSIHEITHAVQFSGAPWLRDYLGGMLTELIEGLQVTMTGGGEEQASGNGGEQANGDGGERGGWRSSLPNVGGWRGSLPDAAELREMVERARRGELLRLTLGEDRWALVERMQAAMSLIEGHAEHTMDAIGAEVLPSLPRLRAAMTHRREHRGLPWRVLERLLGLELKMRQYKLGRDFCDAVVDAGRPPGAGARVERPRGPTHPGRARAAVAVGRPRGRCERGCIAPLRRKAPRTRDERTFLLLQSRYRGSPAVTGFSPGARMRL